VVTREDQVEQSVTDFVRAGLVAAGYGDDQVKIKDAFPSVTERAQELTITTVAVGFNFDDGGQKAELGSDLIRRIYSIEFWTFGISPTYGRNVANVIRFLVEQEWLIPLKAIEQAGQPVIDQLVVVDDRGPTVTRQIANDPRPWDRYVFTTMVKVEDYYMPSQALVVP
jgi:hypothetical protein